MKPGVAFPDYITSGKKSRYNDYSDLKIRHTRGFFLLAILISLLYGIMQFFNLDIFHRQENINRLSGFHRNSYTYGGQILIFLFYLLNKWLIKPRKTYDLILFLSCFFCLLNTCQRSLIIAAIVGFVFYLIFSKLNSRQLILMTTIAIPVFLTYWFHKIVLKRFKNIFSPSLNPRPNVRFKIWKIAIDLWKRNVWIGAGFFPTVAHSYNEFTIKYLTHAHNLYLQILVVNGLIGLVGFLSLFSTIIFILVKSINNSSFALCLLSVLISFSIHGFFEYFWGDSEVRYLLLCFIGFVLGTMFNLKNDTDCVGKLNENK